MNCSLLAQTTLSKLPQELLERVLFFTERWEELARFELLAVGIDLRRELLDLDATRLAAARAEFGSTRDRTDTEASRLLSVSSPSSSPD